MARKQIQKDFPFSSTQPALEKNTPKILKKYRNQAWKAYQSLSFPSLKDEAWRRTSLRDLRVEDLHLPNGKSEKIADLKQKGKILNQQDISDGNTAYIGPAGVETRLDQQLSDQGVILSDLVAAAASTPDLLQKGLGKVINPEEGKFAAATAAFGDKGIFLYVPKGVQVDAPIYLVSYAPGDQSAFFSHLLIYLEEGASLTVYHEAHSPPFADQQSLTGENLEIYVGKNANLQIYEFQTYGDQVWSFGHKKALIDQDGQLDWVMGALGSHLSKHFVSVDLIGKGAEGRISGLFFASEGQHLSYNTLQRHLAPRTNSDLLFKGGLTGNSRSVWRGMIYVAPGAQYIDGYQANRNLILSHSARTDSIPGLEILNNDVRCTHGSTIGKLDQEQLFYLRSRGIPKIEAEQIIIQGFFNEILSRFENNDFQDLLWKAVQEKIASNPK